MEARPPIFVFIILEMNMHAVATWLPADGDAGQIRAPLEYEEHRSDVVFTEYRRPALLADAKIEAALGRMGQRHGSGDVN